ncbi:beta family protein [Vibrio splendidus]
MLFNQVPYVPILSLKPAEMAALEELSSIEKDLLLPLIELKRWANSKTLEKSLDRIEKALGQRQWIADLDSEFIDSIEGKIDAGQVQDVFYQFQDLANPDSGYKNWTAFLDRFENLIPTLQLSEISELKNQLDNLRQLDRPIIARLKMAGPNSLTPSSLNRIVHDLSTTEIKSLFVILDYGDLTRINLLDYHQYSRLIVALHKLLPNAVFSVSGTSFPYSFGRSFRGEIPIYERQIFNKVSRDCPDIRLIYSDRGSTRALSLGGGGGTPPPRIDYPLKNDWRFIRKELDEDIGDTKESLYQSAAKEMMDSDYWLENLPAWGRQMIEKTALGDKYGITSAHRATAVRVNLHLYQQLHYLEDLDDIDTDEDWED